MMFDEDPNDTVSATRKLVDFPYVVTRDPISLKYGEPLKWAANEMIADSIIWSPNLKTGNYTVGVETRLPDGRRLFCFEVTLYLEGGGPW